MTLATTDRVLVAVTPAAGSLRRGRRAVETARVLDAPVPEVVLVGSGVAADAVAERVGRRVVATVPAGDGDVGREAYERLARGARRAEATL